jgi:ATP-dependent helicase Lhr and Lhr-like helicase
VPSLIAPTSADLSAELLPDRFRRWFASRGWSPREHQLALLQKARDDRSALLIAPTGAGKTLAGFLPTLVELSSFSPPPARISNSFRVC